MRIYRSAFLDPRLNRVHAMAAVAGSTFVFAYSTQFGPASILAYYALWLPLLALDYRRALGPPRDLLLPLLLPALAVASTLWSAAPEVSLRGSIQFASHVLCAVIAARVAGTRAVFRGLVLGCLAVVLWSIAFGRYSWDSLDGEFTFVGAFGSKNQLGLYASLAAYFGVALVLSAERLRWRWILAPLAVAALSAGVLVASRSATATIGLIAGTAALVGGLLLLRFRGSARAALLALMVVIVGAAAVTGVQLGAADTVLAAFGKDPTLTGRTYLWSEGIDAGAERPLLGWGYQAYWVHGFREAERLWEEFYIESRTGFHFHNAWIEAFVELGIAGLVVQFVLYVAVTARLVREVLVTRSREGLALLGLMVMLLVRSFAEVDSFYPYTIGAFLLFWLAVPRREAAAARSPAALRPMTPTAYGPSVQGVAGYPAARSMRSRRVP